MSQIHPEPTFVSVIEAARILKLTPWEVYKLLDDQEIASQYRRLVRVDSLVEYAAGVSA